MDGEEILVSGTPPSIDEDEIHFEDLIPSISTLPNSNVKYTVTDISSYQEAPQESDFPYQQQQLRNLS